MALPSLPSLPPLGALGSDPAVGAAALGAGHVQAPAEDPGLGPFQLPDVLLPQLGLPLLAWPELPRLNEGLPPAESPAQPALPAFVDLAASDAQRQYTVQVNAKAEATAKPAPQVLSSYPLSVIEGAFAPTASALQAGVDGAVMRLGDPVSLPQLGLPLLSLPELTRLPSGQAPAVSAALPPAGLRDLAAADMQSPKMRPEQAEAITGTLGSSGGALPGLEAVLAPASSAEAVLTGISSDLSQLTGKAWGLPQLGVPLLALPGAQPSAGAPTPDLAAPMSPMTDPTQLDSMAPLAPDQAPDGHMSTPSQPPFPVPALAPPQQGVDVLADLSRLVQPQLPLIPGLAQAPGLLQDSQGPDLARSPPQPAGPRTDSAARTAAPNLATAPSLPPQPGVPPAQTHHISPPHL